jgi:hypothetical protein
MAITTKSSFLYRQKLFTGGLRRWALVESQTGRLIGGGRGMTFDIHVTSTRHASFKRTQRWYNTDHNQRCRGGSQEKATVIGKIEGVKCSSFCLYISFAAHHAHHNIVVQAVASSTAICSLEGRPWLGQQSRNVSGTKF